MIDNPAKDASFYTLPDSPDRMNAGIPGLTQMIAAGYVVAATDYNGLGAPGFHQYMIGPPAARNVLDGAVTAQHIPQAGAGKRAVVLGWSQGVAPLLSAEEHLEDERRRLRQVIQHYREKRKQAPHLCEKLKQEIGQEFEK
ncbi:MAG: hypothetical protein ACLP5H_00235 [Desulfomonilaceae bacterium]